MKRYYLGCIIFTLFISTLWTRSVIGQEQCSQSDFYLQVLGSGGPIADDGRASSGYLLWVDGESRMMVDTGGGTFLRFGEAKASFSDLDWLGLSHFHADHSSDLSALLKSGYFSDRNRSLALSGPDGKGPFPGLVDFLESILGPQSGAYQYLSGYQHGTDGLIKLDLIELSSLSDKVLDVFQNERFLIESLGVPHGIVPSIAYKITYADRQIVFSSDQNGNDENFIKFIKGVDTLVMHMPVPEGVSGAGRKLHAPPSVIGQIAQKGKVGQLILSHFMARSLRELDSNLDAIGEKYKGPVFVSNDLDCFPIVFHKKARGSGL